MSNELKINKLSRKDYKVKNDKYMLYFINVTCLLAKIQDSSKDHRQYYDFKCLNKGKVFTVFAENKRNAVAELFRLLNDSNLMKRFHGTVFQMI